MTRLFGILILLATSGLHVPAMAQVTARIKIDDAQLVDPDEHLYSAPLGRKVHLSIDASDTTIVTQMIMLPKRRPGFDYYPAERKGTFGSEVPGTCVFIVFATDGTGRPDGVAVDSAILEYGVIDSPPIATGGDVARGFARASREPQVPVERARVMPPPQPQAAMPRQMPARALPTNPVAARVQLLAQQVNSQNFASEAGQIASLFTMRAGQLDQGEQQSTNEFRRVGNLYQQTPANNMAAWYTFFVGMNGVFDELDAQGSFAGQDKRVQNARRAATLRNVADELRAISK